jgi:two-component system chemotaxis sensor kinase CheA
MRFHVTLPMAVVVMDGMVIGVGGVRYVVPLEAIQRIVHATDADLIRVSADRGRHMLKLGHEDIVPVQFLQAKGGSGERPVAGTPGEAKRLFVVIGRDAQRMALSIDELVGQQVLPIRPLQGYLAEMRGVIGCALLGGGEVGMVLDVSHLLSREPWNTPLPKRCPVVP